MLKASEAAVISIQACIYDMEKIEKKIRETAQTGCRSLIHHLDSNTKKSADYIVSELNKAGYKVKRESGSDPRDSESWDYLTITW